MVQVDVATLGVEARAALGRGEAVEVVRGGRVVARLRPVGPGPAETGDGGGETALLADFLARRRAHGPVDDAFEWDMASVRRALNRCRRKPRGHSAGHLGADPCGARRRPGVRTAPGRAPAGAWRAAAHWGILAVAAP